MSEDVIVGIDLGTTFSAVAAVGPHGRPQVLANAEGARTTPSVVYFEEGGTAVVGAVARNMALAEPGRTVQFIKRSMGDPSFQLNIDGTDYVPEGISALILKKLCGDAAGSLGKEVSRAVISVPAYFKDSQRTATRKAGEIAGIEVVAIINEPTAAAIAYGLARSQARRNVLVYDFGGGTFDVTILQIEGNEFTVLATDGDSRLGGIDVDERIANHLAGRFLEHQGVDLRDDAFTRLDLDQKAEKAKVDLSSRHSVSVILSAGTATMRIDLDREKLTELTSDLLGRTRECMEAALSAAGLDYSAIDSLLLVGGSSRMAAVRELAREVTGRDPAVDINPDECVALGAALRAHLADLSERSTPTPGPAPAVAPGQVDAGDGMPVVHDVAPHSLGVRALSPDGRPVNSIIIPRLTVVPCERVRTYATRADSQIMIEIEVLQGESEDPFSPEVEPIGKVRVDELPPRPAGGVVVAVTLRYDADGVVEVVAEELIEGRKIRQQLLRKSGELDEQLTKLMKDRVGELSGPATEEEAPDRDPDGGLARVDQPELEAGPKPDAGPELEAPPDGDLYALVGLSPDASASEIAAAIEEEERRWTELASDAVDPEKREEAEARLAAMAEAQSILLDPVARAEYDTMSGRTNDELGEEPDQEGQT